MFIVPSCKKCRIEYICLVKLYRMNTMKLIFVAMRICPYHRLEGIVWRRERERKREIDVTSHIIQHLATIRVQGFQFTDLRSQGQG